MGNLIVFIINLIPTGISIFFLIVLLIVLGNYLSYKKKIEKSTYWTIVVGIIGMIVSIIMFILSFWRIEIGKFFSNWIYSIILIILMAFLFFIIMDLKKRASIMEKEFIASKLKRLGLIKIEKYLKRGDEKYNEPHFFRWQGPLWIDFEKGYIVEREEVCEIIKNLENRQVFIIGGFKRNRLSEN